MSWLSRRLPSSRIDWRGIDSDATLGRPLPALALAVSMVVIGALATIIDEIMYRFSPTAGPVVRSIVMTLLLFATGIVTGSATTITMASDPRSRTIAVGDTFFIPILGWLLAGAKAAQNQQRRLEAAMMETNEALAWEIARAGETQWQQRRALSRALHGPVQGAIGGAAVRLDLALQAGEPTDTLIVELRGHVVDAIDLLGSQQPATDLNTTIEQLQGVYRGACEITFQSPRPVLRALKDDHTCAATATELVSEAVWNAIRHGKARHVRIDVLPAKPAAIRITVTDDGTITDPEHEDQRGLGTAMLDEVALEWTRQRSNKGTKLVATLPIA